MYSKLGCKCNLLVREVPLQEWYEMNIFHENLVYQIIPYLRYIICGMCMHQGQSFVQVVKNEGPTSLYRGLTPALMRSVLYGGLRLGLYEPSKYVCESAFESTNILMKIASGAFSGALATALTNPVEILKVLCYKLSTEPLRPCLT